MNNFKKYKIEDESFENDNNNSLNNLNIESDFPNNNLAQMNNPNISNITNQLTSSQLTHTLLQSQTHQHPLQKQSLPYSQPEQLTAINNNPVEEQINDDNEPYHHVQIIDEDVENFKRRLDIMIKNFRTDTLKDFMSIKRNLLLEQKSVIESEKQKCDALLSTKGDLIEHLKDDLAKTQKQLSDQIQIKENVVNILFKQNYSKRQKQLKHLAFIKVLKGYHDKKKNKKDKIKKMRDSYHFKLKMKLFMFLKQNAKEMKIFKIVSAKEKECNDKLNEMAQYYGKEISTLRNRLNEANVTIEKSKESQNAIQENLKKVLMRGVMAMNMEAMNVLDTNSMGSNQMQMQQEITQQIPQQVVVNQSFQPNQNKYMNDINVNEVENNNDNNGEMNGNEQNNAIVNLNPVGKDSHWINASAVPLSMKQNILVNNQPEEEYEDLNIQISDGNNNNNNQFLYDESNEEGDSVPYKNKIPTPMNHPNDYNFNNRTNMFYQQQQQPQISNASSYYDEMQKNLLNIKNEFSAIKQNSVTEDSFNNSGFMNTYMQPGVSVNVNPNTNNYFDNNNNSNIPISQSTLNQISNYSTVSNTNIMTNNSNRIPQMQQNKINKKKVTGNNVTNSNNNATLNKKNSFSNTMKKPPTTNTPNSTRKVIKK